MAGGGTVSPNIHHPHDITELELAIALRVSESVQILQELVATSRSSFGFFTSHFPHTLNYPWIVERVLRMPRESRVLDVGAGVSPVPLLLSAKGMRVTCIDSHPVIRKFPVAVDWNEWGYLDYSALDTKIKSIHGSVLDYKPMDPYDAIYSISVLAHMTHDAREAAVERSSRWLRPGGSLLLAIDLIPACDFLWNRSGGKVVEPLMKHGTSQDVLAQLRSLGMSVVEAPILRGVRTSRTDLLLIHATKAPGMDIAT